jgi:hypothetical protein
VVVEQPNEDLVHRISLESNPALLKRARKRRSGRLELRPTLDKEAGHGTCTGRVV